MPLAEADRRQTEGEDPMDDRTSEIREGAGLEESRINREFIDLLQKWSSPVLLVLAVIVGLYAGNNWLQAQRNNRVNEAFNQHAEITETASPPPASLRAVAAEYGDVRGVGLMAKLRHADVLLQAVRVGMVPGAEFVLDENNRATGEVAETDRLSDEEAARYLDEASALYAEVADEAGDEMGQQIHRLSAFMGLASVAEMQGDPEAARRAYAEAEAAARAAGFPVFESLAQARAADADRFAQPVALLSRSDLPSTDDDNADSASESETLSPVELGPVAPEAPLDTEQDGEPLPVEGDALPASEPAEDDE
ncbi:MAG: hypothetical protein ACTS22_02315 [Phycisphaerales bacterium]